MYFFQGQVIVLELKRLLMVRKSFNLCTINTIMYIKYGLNSFVLKFSVCKQRK